MKSDIDNAEPLGIGENKFTSITLNGDVITDKKIAGEKLLEAIKTVKINENKVVGAYRGFGLEIGYNFMTNEHNFSLNGATKHYGELGDSAEGNITRLDNAIERMSDKLDKLEQKFVDTKEQFENAKEELKKSLGLELDKDGNIYDQLANDLDNDNIADRYDNDFKDSDYLESTYDVDDNLNSEEEKTSILEQIKSYQSETRDSDVKENKSKEHGR